MAYVNQYNSKKNTSENHTCRKGKKTKKEKIEKIMREEFGLKKDEIELALLFYQEQEVLPRSMKDFDVINNKILLVDSRDSELISVKIAFDKKLEKCIYKIEKDRREISTQSTELSDLKSGLGIKRKEEIRKNLKPVIGNYVLNL